MNNTINARVMEANETIIGVIWEMFNRGLSKAYIDGTTLLCCDPKWLYKEFKEYLVYFDPTFNVCCTDLTDGEEFAIWLVKSDDDRFDLEIIIDTADSRYLDDLDEEEE